MIDPRDDLKILDVGAGHGAFTKRLYDEGFNVSACDMTPENFYFDAIECRKADITRELPYEDQSFDVVLLIEVMEHIHDHQTLFSECHRILKKGGFMFFSTPNILNLKSRMRFLYTGFFDAFKPLDHSSHDGMQHISSITIDQYTHLSAGAGFTKIEIAIDKKQKSSRWLSFLIPLIWLTCKIKGIAFPIHNTYEYLTGRLLLAKVTK